MNYRGSDPPLYFSIMITLELNELEFAQLECLLEDGLTKHEEDMKNTPEFVRHQMISLGIFKAIGSLKVKVRNAKMFNELNKEHNRGGE